MQTLLAFACPQHLSPDRLRAGRDRVERWYGPRWGAAASRTACTSRRGLLLWDRPDEECRWPSWAGGGAEVAATLQVPLGYERLVGDTTLPAAPLALARRLIAAPADVLRLTPPFVVAHLDRDRDRLTLMTDPLGIGRLYELHTAEGRFWSNRPVAALLFAGVRAEADELAWQQLAGCDWAMGERTPYAGVRVVGAATQLVSDGHGFRSRSLDVLAQLAGGRSEPLSEQGVDEAAAALVDTARSVSRLWPMTPTLGLSGGRDSRLVVAAFVAAGVDVGLKTYAGAAGEEETARELVARLPRPLPHEVTGTRGKPQPVAGFGAYARARQWHDLTEGLRPALYLKSSPPRLLLRQHPPLICGVGGEFAHAPGYPNDVQRLERLPPGRRLQAWGDSLQAKIVLPRGVAGHAEAAVREQVDRVLQHSAARGVSDAKALDWFYADERLRRWGLAGESFGRVLPLLAPEFVRAAFALTTGQSVDSALHTALISRLVPAWRDVAFFGASLKQRQSVTRRRLWEADDVPVLSSVFASASDWGGAFDVGVVQDVWRAALAGRAAARDELLLQRVVWRAAFTDHLAAVNGQPPLDRGAGSVAVTGQRPQRVLGPLRVLAMHANDVPVARRLARSPIGRQLRRRLGV